MVNATGLTTTEIQGLLTNSKLKKLQEIELFILKDIIKICEKFNIEYFMTCGSVLGAVRHGGFIPWDDDTDIGMTRDNYDKFLSIAISELDENLFLQNIYTDSDSPYCYTKIRRNNTKLIVYKVRNINCHQGIFVDIVPFDKTPDDFILRKIHIAKTRLYGILHYAKQNLDYDRRSGTLEVNCRYILHRFRQYIVKPIPKRLLFNLLDKERRRYNNKSIKSESYISFDHPRGNKDHIFPVKKIKFEDIYANVPNNCDAYLTILYGDYMTPPPPNKRQAHNMIIVDVDVTRAS